MRDWRGKSTTMRSTRPIYKEEYPKLIKAMINDGLIAIITAEGIKWYHGDYRVTKKVICGVWNITPSQMKKLTDYIYGHVPFYKTAGGGYISLLEDDKQFEWD